MKQDKYYLNCDTGEITFEHRTAMEWYREGTGVEIWLNGKMCLKWLASGDLIEETQSVWG